MKIADQIEGISQRLKELLKDVEELRTQLGILERKNEQLSHFLQKEDRSQGAGNLIKLYEQGFHICHGSFGGIREEDCLFCLNVIDRTE